MEDVYFDTVESFNDNYGVTTLHPLVSVVRFDGNAPQRSAIYHYGLYALFLKENKVASCRMAGRNMILTR